MYWNPAIIDYYSILANYSSISCNNYPATSGFNQMFLNIKNKCSSVVSMFFNKKEKF
jgi:hypothetical protein